VCGVPVITHGINQRDIDNIMELTVKEIVENASAPVTNVQSSKYITTKGVDMLRITLAEFVQQLGIVKGDDLLQISSDKRFYLNFYNKAGQQLTVFFSKNATDILADNDLAKAGAYIGREEFSLFKFMYREWEAGVNDAGVAYSAGSEWKLSSPKEGEGRSTQSFEDLLG
jgi:hypothetical protein